MAGDGESHWGVPGRWANCGVADGRRPARHLGSWSPRAQLLVAANDDDAAVQEMLDLVGELAQSVRRCRWPDRSADATWHPVAGVR